MKKILIYLLIIILSFGIGAAVYFIIKDVTAPQSDASIETPVDPGGEAENPPDDSDDEDQDTPNEPGDEEQETPDDPSIDEPDDPVKVIDVWDGTKDATWYNTTDDEFILTTPEQLAGINDLPFDSDLNSFRKIKIKLGADIYLNYENSNNVWTPIASSDNSFSWDIDGQGYTIYGLKFEYSKTFQNNHAFIADTQDSNISNLIFDGAIIDQTGMTDPGNEDLIAGKRCAGVVVGHAEGNTTFENIKIKNSKVTGDKYSYTGSIAGYYSTEGKEISNIEILNSNLKGKYVGGIFGAAGNNLIFNNIKADVNVNSSDLAAGIVGKPIGGLCGKIYNANINIAGECENFGAFVTAKNPQINSPLLAYIENSKITGAIETENYYLYNGTTTKEYRVENTLKINGIEAEDSFEDEIVKFFQGNYNFYNPTAPEFVMYELIIKNDKVEMNQVEKDGTGYAGIYIKHIKDFKIKNTMVTDKFYITMESEDGESILLSFDINNNAIALKSDTGYYGDLKLTPAN